MSGPTPAADETYGRIVARLSGEPGVGVGKMFRSEGLNHEGRYFALLTRGELVVKLPAPRVAALTAAGTGRPFEPSPGRTMREWLSVPDAHAGRWPALADEALAFARDLGPR